MVRKSFTLFSLMVIMAVALAGCVQPEPITSPTEGSVTDTSSAAAESGSESMTDAAPGGVWTRSSSADASILNPILSSDSASSAIHSQIFPTMIGQDPFTGELVPDYGALASSWSSSEDGLTWTFDLRDDMQWSDGEQVDANDVKFTYDAIASDLVDTPRKSNVERIESMTVVDDFTLEVVFSDLQCDALSDLGLGILPSHLYADDFSDIMENEMNEAPTISAGPLTFQSWTRDDNAILVRNENYVLGAPNMDGMIYKVVPDPGARLAQLQSGEVDSTGLQPEQLEVVEAATNLNRFRFFDDGYTYIGLNLADPNDPLAGQDEDGNLVEQTPHPILSDRNIRLAMAHALDYDSIIESVYLGQGYQIASNVLPAVSWAHDDSIEPYAYDPDLAVQILDDAGYVDVDGDGFRETPDGEPMVLELLTNSGNTTREDLGVLVQDQLGAIGLKIDFQAIDFGTMVDLMLGQNYDMVIIGWTGLGADPNDDSFWHSKFDTPESGFNFVSYNNPEIDRLLDEGVAVVGCAPADRAPIYQEIQQIIHDDIPYLFVTGSVGNWGYNAEWGNVDPGEWSTFWNLETWFSKALQP